MRVAIAIANVIQITTGSKVDVFVFVFVIVSHGEGTFDLICDVDGDG
jgi:hypothetical protein